MYCVGETRREHYLVSGGKYVSIFLQRQHRQGESEGGEIKGTGRGTRREGEVRVSHTLSISSKTDFTNIHLREGGREGGREGVGDMKAT